MQRAEVITRLRAGGCVWAEDEAELLLVAGGDLDALVRRRTDGEPLEQVLGWASFCGMRLRVRPGVFVPRRRSEFLVATAVATAGATAVTTAVRGGPPRPVVLDLCAGVGALGTAFAASVEVGELHVAELNQVALDCARSNVPPGTELYLGDLYEPLPAALRNRVDVLLANAPYVPTAELGLLPPEARDHEPTETLDGGGDGLDLHRRIVAAAPQWLAPGGTIFIEVSEGQRDTALALMSSAGLMPDVEVDDDLGATVVLGTRRPNDGNRDVGTH